MKIDMMNMINGKNSLRRSTVRILLLNLKVAQKVLSYVALLRDSRNQPWKSLVSTSTRDPFQVKLFSDSVEISLGYEPTPGKLVLGVIQGHIEIH